jgi:glycosyltransferase involved in cell wall biosynthesis
MNSKNIRVLFVIPSVKSGGIETYLLRFLKYLNNSLDVVILVRSNNKDELLEAYKKTGARIVFKPLGNFNPSRMIWFYCFLKTNGFDVVCDFNANFAGQTMMLSKLAKIKKRITFYRQSSHLFVNPTRFKIAYSKFLNRLVYKFSTNIFANSATALNFFFKSEYPTDKRFEVIRNGIEIEEYIIQAHESKEQLRQKLGLPTYKFLIGHTGRFTEAKNHYFLLDVAKRLIDADSTVFFVLIGNNTDKLIPYIEKLGISRNIQVLGYRNNISEYLKAFDMFFFPSVTEGQPNALIEAMATGLPIITSKIAAIEECIPHESHCCLIDPYNAETTALKISEARNNSIAYTFKEYAVEKFDSAILFKVLKDKLLDC